MKHSTLRRGIKRFNITATLVATFALAVGSLSACSVHYHHHKKGGHGGVIIQIPPTKEPEVKPIPENNEQK